MANKLNIIELKNSYNDVFINLIEGMENFIVNDNYTLTHFIYYKEDDWLFRKQHQYVMFNTNIWNTIEKTIFNEI